MDSLPNMDLRSHKDFPLVEKLFYKYLDARLDDLVNSVSVWHIAGTDKTQFGMSSACHRSMKWVNNADFFATGLFTPQDRSAADFEKFYGWIISDDSPWKMFLKDGYELIRREGDLCGLVVPGSAVQYDAWNVWFNYCIALRAPREKPDMIHAWARFVEEGLHPADAFFLCRHYTYRQGRFFPSSTSNNGAHWALSCVNSSWSGSTVHRHSFDFNTFRAGQPLLNEVTKNGCWCPHFVAKYTSHDGQGRYNIVGRDEYYNLVKEAEYGPKVEGRAESTRFSKAVFYDISDILEDFFTWQKSRGFAPMFTKKEDNGD